MKGSLKLFLVICLFLLSPLTSFAARDGGHDVTSNLWVKAILQVPGHPVTLKWEESGVELTPSGDSVVSGYFYADPHDFAYGGQFNPEVFVKIYITASGWCNIAFNHVTVDNVSISSARNYAGAANQTSMATTSSRVVEHQYNGIPLAKKSFNFDGSWQGSATLSGSGGYCGFVMEVTYIKSSGQAAIIWGVDRSSNLDCTGNWFGKVYASTSSDGKTVCVGGLYAFEDGMGVLDDDGIYCFSIVNNDQIKLDTYVTINGQRIRQQATLNRE